MRLKKLLSTLSVLVLSASLVACGNNNGSTNSSTGSGSGSTDLTVPTYDQLKLGEDYTDLTASITIMTHRTDLVDNVFQDYITEFQKVYPNISIEYDATTDYSETALLRLTSEDWGDIMMIPTIDKAELSTYFISFGDYDTLNETLNFVNGQLYDGQVYGIPSTGNAQGIVYNKRIFEEAGVTEIPKTPEEFIDALQKIKDNTDAIPLYTNYFAGWTMGAWDGYLGGSSLGSSTYLNQDLVHTKNPFIDPGDGTDAYNVYKILYDAVANGLTEEDYSTTDWEGSKVMLNNGEIATMVLGSWAVIQMQEAGDNADDIGYMPFPITVDGKQYATAAGDYNYGINVNASVENQIASMCYIKWLTEESNFSYDQGGIPILKDAEYPETFADFEDVELVTDESALSGEESLLSEVNAESGLNINNNGDTKVQAIVEHAFNGTKTFDEIMEEWNQAWSDAMDSLDVEAK